MSDSAGVDSQSSLSRELARIIAEVEKLEIGGDPTNSQNVQVSLTIFSRGLDLMTDIL